jgi:hypothetical protein
MADRQVSEALWRETDICSASLLGQEDPEVVVQSAPPTTHLLPFVHLDHCGWHRGSAVEAARRAHSGRAASAIAGSLERRRGIARLAGPNSD